MRNLFLLLIVFQFLSVKSQTALTYDEILGKKGKVFIAWGWNRSVYSHSDIRFEGADYDFTLNSVIAKDRQSEFKIATYLSPVNITIPQYNFRIGVFLNERLSISLGQDHMKYVMQADQVVKINGTISNSGTYYDGIYENQDIKLTKDFLQFEHTDGLNYGNLSLRHNHSLLERPKINIYGVEGIGIGVLVPRTNTILMNNDRYDEFHFSGYGADATIGLNFEFFKWFYLQPEIKGVYVNMQDIRTTMNDADKAHQQFMALQANCSIGFLLDLRIHSFKKKSEN